MFSKISTAAAAVIAASTLVSAQTFTDCNPLQEDCPADPAFGSQKVSCDFTRGECSAFHHLEGTDVDYNSNGALFRIQRETNAPTIATDKYIFFGRVDVVVQAAAGNGIVTSLVLQSDCLDEIDWEWVGGDDLQAQSNYFSKGDDSTFDRGAYHTVDHPLTTFHTYSFEWTPEAVHWIIDDVIVRTLTYEEAKGGSAFPQTPMQIKMGTWVAGGSTSPEGTAEWAGGYTDFDAAPFDAIYKSISIVDYAGGSAPSSSSVREYVYGDRTGDYESIELVGGSGSGNNNNETPSSSTAAEEEDEETSTSASATRTSAAPTSSHASSHSATTTASESEDEETTSAVTSAPSSTAAASSTLSTTTTLAATTPGGPAETGGADEPSAASHGAVAYGTLMLVGAAVVAQLL
jgi:beta-glucanase (GH16 family)